MFEILSPPSLSMNPVGGMLLESNLQERRSCGRRDMAAFTCSVFLTSRSLPSGAATEASCFLQTWLLCASSDWPCCSARRTSAQEPCPPQFLHKMLQTRMKTCTFQKMLLVFRACILGSTLRGGLPWALLLLFALLCFFPCGLRRVSSAFVALMRKLELADSVSLLDRKWRLWPAVSSYSACLGMASSSKKGKCWFLPRSSWKLTTFSLNPHKPFFNDQFYRKKKKMLRSSSQHQPGVWTCLFCWTFFCFQIFVCFL